MSLCVVNLSVSTMSMLRICYNHCVCSMRLLVSVMSTCCHDSCVRLGIYNSWLNHRLDICRLNHWLNVGWLNISRLDHWLDHGLLVNLLLILWLLLHVGCLGWWIWVLLLLLHRLLVNLLLHGLLLVNLLLLHRLLVHLLLLLGLVICLFVNINFYDILGRE